MAQAEQKQKLGFIGLGHMGVRMAGRLLAAGYPLTVWDRDANHAKELAGKGAQAAASPKELAAGVDVVLVSVTDDAAVKDVVLGEGGVLAGLKKGAVLIDLSSVYPGTSRHVHQEAQGHGVEMLDAPVSGSTPQAQEGSLVALVGGDRGTFERCRPILEAFAKQCHYMGPVGAGTTMKLVVNTLLGVEMQAIAEAIALGEKAGLDRDRLLDVLGQTALIAPAFKAKIENAKKQEYPVAFALHLMRKDFSLILRLAAEVNACMPATAVAEQMYASELARGKDQDFSAIVRQMEELSGEKAA